MSRATCRCGKYKPIDQTDCTECLQGFKKAQARSHDIPGYRHRFDAFGRFGNQTVNMSELTNTDFKKAVVDILCLNGLLVGAKTPYQVEIEAAENKRRGEGNEASS